MHRNFYHWHNRVVLKPDPKVLEPRWNAAAEFGKQLSSDNVPSLLRLTLFSGGDVNFAQAFTEALVKAEPTFPITQNSEILRVMGTASIYSQLENSSAVTDALTLGIHAAAFLPERITLFSEDLFSRATEYLIDESEGMRPEIDAGNLTDVKKKLESLFVALKTATDTNNPQEIGKGVGEFGRGVLMAIEKSHKQLGDVIDRLTEESQFLWWLVGNRSKILNRRRSELSAEVYALPAAIEASVRVTRLPPAPSVESLLEGVLNQCNKTDQDSFNLIELVRAAAGCEWIKSAAEPLAEPVLTPLAALVAEIKADRKLDQDSLDKLFIPANTKVAPIEASRQYFRELMFLRAMGELL